MKLRNSAGDVLVELSEDTTANGERLRVSSALTGEVAFADAIMLDALTWIPANVLGISEASTEEAES